MGDHGRLEEAMIWIDDSIAHYQFLKTKTNTKTEGVLIDGMITELQAIRKVANGDI